MSFCQATSFQSAHTQAVRCQRSALSRQPAQPVSRHTAVHLSSCRPAFQTFTSKSHVRRRMKPRAASNAADLPLIQSEDEFSEALAGNKVIVVDWMAKWCRKCIYLKPKIQKMMEAEFPDLPIVYIDVNAVPGKLVYSNGIKKMPTIALYHNQAKVAEHIAAEGSKDAVAKIKEMIETGLKAPEVAEKAAA